MSTVTPEWGDGYVGSEVPDTSRATRILVAIVLAVIAAYAVAGCGGSGATTATTSTAPPSTSSTQPTRRPPRKPAKKSATRRPSPPVGTTQRVKTGTSTLSVTVTRLIDPLRDSGAAPLPGTHAVGVMLSIRDDSGATYDSTASGDVSLVASSGTASPLFIKQGICQTPLVDFESLIGVGEVRDGCVGFSLPQGARIRAVRFSPHSRAPGTVSWR